MPGGAISITRFSDTLRFGAVLVVRMETQLVIFISLAPPSLSMWRLYERKANHSSPKHLCCTNARRNWFLSGELIEVTQVYTHTHTHWQAYRPNLIKLFMRGKGFSGTSVRDGAHTQQPVFLPPPLFSSFSLSLLLPLSLPPLMQFNKNLPPNYTNEFVVAGLHPSLARIGSARLGSAGLRAH